MQIGRFIKRYQKLPRKYRVIHTVGLSDRWFIPINNDVFGCWQGESTHIYGSRSVYCRLDCSVDNIQRQRVKLFVLLVAIQTGTINSDFHPVFTIVGFLPVVALWLWVVRTIVRSAERRIAPEEKRQTPPEKPSNGSWAQIELLWKQMALLLRLRRKTKRMTISEAVKGIWLVWWFNEGNESEEDIFFPLEWLTPLGIAELDNYDKYTACIFELNCLFPYTTMESISNITVGFEDFQPL